MISANAAVSPQCPTGARSMPVRMPRPMTQWHLNAAALWTGCCSPCGLNGTRRVSPLHNPISTGSAPGSNPQITGWWTISADWRIRETKPAVNEWGVFGGNRHRFWTPTASSRSSAVGAAFPRPNAGSLPYGCLAGISSVRPGAGRYILSYLDSKPIRTVIRRSVARCSR